MNLVLRRALAWVIDAVIITLVLALGLWRSVLTGWLYPYNGKLLGSVIVIVVACATAALANETLGDRIMGLRVQTIEGATPPLISRTVRAFLLWFMILQIPTPPGFVYRFASFDGAQGLGLAFVLISTTIIPMWVLATGGKAGFHDVLTAVRVEAKSRAGMKGQPVSLDRLVGLTLAVFSTVAFVYSGFAWSNRLVPKLMNPGPLQYLGPYVFSTGPARMIQTIGDRDVSPMEAYYTAPDNIVHYNGTTFYLAFPTSVHNVVDGSRAIDQAYHDWWTVRPYLPADTRWVEIMLFSSEEFGFVEYSTSTRVLLMLPERKWLFPPHLPFEGERMKPYGFKDSFDVGSGNGVKTVYFNQQIDGTFGLAMSNWDLLSFNYLRDRKPRFRDDL